MVEKLVMVDKNFFRKRFDSAGIWHNLLIHPDGRIKSHSVYKGKEFVRFCYLKKTKTRPDYVIDQYKYYGFIFGRGNEWKFASLNDIFQCGTPDVFLRWVILSENSRYSRFKIVSIEPESRRDIERFAIAYGKMFVLE